MDIEHSLIRTSMSHSASRMRRGEHYLRVVFTLVGMYGAMDSKVPLKSFIYWRWE